MVIEMSKLFLEDVHNVELERMKCQLNLLLKFDTDVRTAFGIVYADARLVVNAWDDIFWYMLFKTRLMLTMCRVIMLIIFIMLIPGG
jgi:hypothetical protein